MYRFGIHSYKFSSDMILCMRKIAGNTEQGTEQWRRCGGCKRRSAGWPP